MFILVHTLFIQGCGSTPVSGATPSNVGSCVECAMVVIVERLLGRHKPTQFSPGLMWQGWEKPPPNHFGNLNNLFLLCFGFYVSETFCILWLYFGIANYYKHFSALPVG